METNRPEANGAAFKSVLGLSGEPGEQVAAPEQRGTLPGTVLAQLEPEQMLELTVIVPARNEEDCLGACLRSLVSQSEEIFELGKDWELIVVDDHSTDRTSEIVSGFAGVTVMANCNRAGRGRRMPFGRR